MPIALERGREEAIGCFPIYEPPEAAGVPPPAAAAAMAMANSSSSSSSIGKNSDRESDGGVDTGEVQSAYKGPLEVMDALEESLPIRRGISNFYRGKSKSFTTLADAMSSCSSSKDLAKPVAESAYTRKRRNLLAFKNTWERPHSSPLRSSAGGISKRHPSSSRSTLALAVAMYNSPSSSSSSTSSEEEEHDQRWLLPPLHPPGKPAAPFSSSSPSQKHSLPMRSYSLTDLKDMAGSSGSDSHGDNHKRHTSSGHPVGNGT